MGFSLNKGWESHVEWPLTTEKPLTFLLLLSMDLMEVSHDSFHVFKLHLCPEAL